MLQGLQSLSLGRPVIVYGLMTVHVLVGHFRSTPVCSCYAKTSLKVDWHQI